MNEANQSALDDIERELRNLQMYSPSTRRRHQRRLYASRRRLLLTEQDRNEENERRRRRYQTQREQILINRAENYHLNQQELQLRGRLYHQNQRINEGLPPINAPVNVIIT